MRGKIIKGIAGFYYVYAEDGGIYECRAKGIFRKDGKKPLVGDNVIFEITHVKDMEGSVTELLPRKNSLIRPAVANVDQSLVIFAAEDPEPNFMLLDRFLIMMEQNGIPARICFNKTDLGRYEELDRIRKTYEACGYQVFLMSIARGEGVDEVRNALLGKTTVVAGPSGVGKSSLTNELQKEIRMETGEISRKLKRGRQTTRHSEIVPVNENTFFVDTPGFSSLYLIGIEEQELKGFFPEFRKYEDRCRFQGCRHLQEPDCAVRAALEREEISRIRYEDYKSLWQELAEKRKY